MATSFPTSLDALTNPISTNALNSPSHADQHANANDAIEAIQAAIGTTAAPVLAKLASPTFTGTLSAAIISTTDTIASAGRGEFTTVAAAGRGVGIRGGTGDTQSILQFTNNAMTVQWTTITSTNGTLNLNGALVTTAGDFEATNKIAANRSTSKYVTIGDWQQSSNYAAVNGNKGYLLLGNLIGDPLIYLRSNDNAGTVNIGAGGSNTFVVANGSAVCYGNLGATGSIGGSYLAAGLTGVTDAGSVSATNWFRPTGDTGIYFQSWGGGWHMSDATWIRAYNGKNVYMPAVVRCGYTYSGNAGRVRGSYGSVSFDANGSTGGWDGIEFTGSPQTFMVYTDMHSGMYRNNNTWNWLWNYSTLQVGSDERYKRDIQPLGLGMKFVEHLEPISYLKLTEETDDDPEATENGYYYGFTAQNVRAALDACGETRDVKIHDIGGPNMGLVACVEGAVYDRQFIGISEFMAPVVEAIKELNERVKTLEGV